MPTLSIDGNPISCCQPAIAAPRSPAITALMSVRDTIMVAWDKVITALRSAQDAIWIAWDKVITALRSALDAIWEYLNSLMIPDDEAGEEARFQGSGLVTFATSVMAMVYGVPFALLALNLGSKGRLKLIIGMMKSLGVIVLLIMFGCMGIAYVMFFWGPRYIRLARAICFVTTLFILVFGVYAFAFFVQLID